MQIDGQLNEARQQLCPSSGVGAHDIAERLAVDFTHDQERLTQPNCACLVAHQERDRIAIYLNAMKSFVFTLTFGGGLCTRVEAQNTLFDLMPQGDRERVDFCLPTITNGREVAERDLR